MHGRQLGVPRSDEVVRHPRRVWRCGPLGAACYHPPRP